MRFKLYGFIVLALFMAVGFTTTSYAQIASTGTAERASSQLIYYFNELQSSNFLSVN